MARPDPPSRRDAGGDARGAAALAAASGRGHEHLRRSMRAHLGISPTAYLDRMRVDHAAALLRDADMGVAEVAEAVGLAGLGHLHGLFLARRSVTPRAFRKLARRAPV